MACVARLSPVEMDIFLFQVGKSCLRFADPAELPADAIGAVAGATPRYLEIVTAMRSRPGRRGSKRPADG
jgi:hypothetical protein